MSPHPSDIPAYEPNRGSRCEPQEESGRGFPIWNPLRLPPLFISL